jgi:murein DD-endopeptidase MepM/ murein hydrolase activator NlpD
MPFPLPFVPRLDYHPSRGHNRHFRARRPKGRLHAGCDLVAPRGTPVFAIDDGIVEEYAPSFFRGTSAISVRHPGYVARYCELDPASVAALRPGMKVRAGQQIAAVGKMSHDSMLHFELYSGKSRGALTMRTNPPFQRRYDLLDPTAFLDTLKYMVNVCHGHVNLPSACYEVRT